MRQRSVLIVDDSPEDREFVRAHLLSNQDCVYTVLEAELGEQGLRICQETPLDCVLLDQNLPDIELDEFLDALTGGSLPAPVPVVVLTGQGHSAQAAAALKRGAQDYLLKGTTTREGLARAVENAVEKWEIQRQIQQQRADLEIRNRQLETFAAVVAHDLRNPVGLIETAAGFLLDVVLPAEGRDVERKQLAIIRRSAMRANRLIHDLMDVARLEAGHLELARQHTPATFLVRDAIELHQASASEKQVRLEARADPGLGTVYVDRDRVLQVFDNLISNAIKFTPEGGRVWIDAEARDHDIRFGVMDTGTGIPADQVPHLFDRFWQARQHDRRGLGLGLSISKGIVEAHGGRIWVESTEGRGSSFLFTVPAAIGGAPT